MYIYMGINRNKYLKRKPPKDCEDIYFWGQNIKTKKDFREIVYWVWLSVICWCGWFQSSSLNDFQMMEVWILVFGPTVSNGHVGSVEAAEQIFEQQNGRRFLYIMGPSPETQQGSWNVIFLGWCLEVSMGFLYRNLIRVHGIMVGVSLPN